MSQKPDSKYQLLVAKKEVKILLDQLEDLNKWLTDNLGHPDWEKVARNRNNLGVKITSKEQRIERQEYPARFKQEESPYILTQNIR